MRLCIPYHSIQKLLGFRSLPSESCCAHQRAARALKLQHAIYERNAKRLRVGDPRNAARRARYGAFRKLGVRKRDFRRVQLAHVCRSEANDLALRLARDFTHNEDIIVLEQ